MFTWSEDEADVQVIPMLVILSMAVLMLFSGIAIAAGAAGGLLRGARIRPTGPRKRGRRVWEGTVATPTSFPCVAAWRRRGQGPVFLSSAHVAVPEPPGIASVNTAVS